MKEYVKSLFLKTLGAGVIPALILLGSEASFIAWLITFLVIAILVSYGVCNSILKEREEKYTKDISETK